MTDNLVGHRVRSRNDEGFVHFDGGLPGEEGSWLGVEWDDHSRGSHDGTHEGVRYFQPVSESPTSSSFIRKTDVEDLGIASRSVEVKLIV